jgi:putative ABC transport system permease protein
VNTHPLRHPEATIKGSQRNRTTRRVRWQDLLREGLPPLRDRPSRSLLTSVGVAVGAATFVITAGLQATNGAQIRTTLGNLRSTQVLAQVSLPPAAPVTGTDIKQLQTSITHTGAVSGSVSWLIDDQKAVGNLAPAATGIKPPQLAVVAATGSLLQTAEVRTSPASAITAMDAHQPMILVGRAVATQLNAHLGDTLQMDNRAWTVSGFIDDSRLRPDLLLSLVVPADVALTCFRTPTEVEVLLRTAPGQAEAVARRVPAALAPDEPGRVVALTLRRLAGVSDDHAHR